MKKYLELLKNIEVWKNTKMYCIFADQALQDNETCGLLEDERGCAVYKKSAWDCCCGNYRPARCNFSARGLSKMQKVTMILDSTKTTTHFMSYAGILSDKYFWLHEQICFL